MRPTKPHPRKSTARIVRSRTDSPRKNQPAARNIKAAQHPRKQNPRTFQAKLIPHIARTSPFEPSRISLSCAPQSDSSYTALILIIYTATLSCAGRQSDFRRGADSVNVTISLTRCFLLQRGSSAAPPPLFSSLAPRISEILMNRAAPPRGLIIRNLWPSAPEVLSRCGAEFAAAGCLQCERDSYYICRYVKCV